MAGREAHNIVHRFNEGVHAYKRARALIKGERWDDSEASLRLAVTQSVGALEWALKAHLRHPARLEQMAPEDRAMLKQPTFNVLMRLLRRYGSVQIGEEASASLYSYRSLRNEVEHGGGVPSILSVEAALAEVGETVAQLLGIDRKSLAQMSEPAAAAVWSRRLFERSHPLCGREAELALMCAALERAASDRRGQMILVSGKSGTGKSFLCEEACRAAIELGYDVAFTACEPFQQGVALFPIMEILRQVSGHTSPYLAVEELYPANSSQVSIARLAEDNVGDANRRRDAYVASFANALYGRFAGSYVEPQRPILIFLDDMEWIDSATSDAMLCLRGRFAEGPVVVLGAYRKDLVNADPKTAHPLRPLINLAMRYPREATGLSLEGLRKSDLGATASAILGGPCDFTPSQYGRLFAETEGNPLFLREILGALAKSGADGEPPALEFTGGAWRFGHQMGRMTLPATIEEAIESRLGGLSPEQQQALEKAAVVGRHFAYSLLSQLSDQPESVLLDSLESLIRADVIREAQDSGEATLEFTHVKIREVIYGRIPRFRRRAMHKRTAEALLELRPALKVQNFEALVGVHLYHAGCVEEASPHLLLGARASMELFSVSQAVEQYAQALEACAVAGYPPGASASSLKLEYANALAQAGRYHDAIVELSSALAADPKPRERGEALDRLGDLYWLTGQFELAKSYYDRCEEIAEKGGFPDLALEVAADLFEFHDREAERLAGVDPEASRLHEGESARFLDKQIQLAAVAGSGATLSRAYRNEAKRLRKRGDLAGAIARYEQALSVEGRASVDHSILISYAKTLRFAGRAVEAREIVERVLDWGVQSGALRTEAIGRQYRAMLMMECADPAASDVEEEILKAISLHEEIGYARGLREARILLGEWHASRGNWPQAVAVFRLALNMDGNEAAVVRAIAAQLVSMGEDGRAERLRIGAAQRSPARGTAA